MMIRCPGFWCGQLGGLLCQLLKEETLEGGVGLREMMGSVLGRSSLCLAMSSTLVDGYSYVCRIVTVGLVIYFWESLVYR